MTIHQTPDDARPIRADVDNRRTAYKEVIGRHEAHLLRASRRMCGGQEDRAQDLVQDALIRGYEAFIDGRFQPGTNERAWLLRILTNLFINDYQKRNKWESGVDIDHITPAEAKQSSNGIASDGDVPHLALMANVMDESLENALAGLSDEQRACVVLVDIEGAEYKDAAAALDIPIGTVRSRLARARLQLHALLYNYAQDRRLA